MNLNFVTDPEMAPRPREDIKIEELSVEAYPDNKRFRINISITPFAPADRPNLELIATTDDKNTVGSLSIIDTVHRTLTLTMHLKKPLPPNTESIVFEGILYYEPGEIHHSTTTKIRQNTP